VARKRQARRCEARRSDGQPCGAFAITGGWVCAAHGGSARRVRHAARARQVRDTLNLAFGQAYQRWRREAGEWQVRRFLAAASILGVSPADVTPGDILYLVWEGQLPGEASAPRIRVDRRYGPRTRGQLATRAARQAERKALAAGGTLSMS
jgi:hypothetical protein